MAPAPSANAGLTAGLTDRNAAHALADQQCMGNQGQPCRLALEFHERCGAVAQGLAPRGLSPSHARDTFMVVTTTAGAGASRSLAEQSALAACRQRFRGTCQVARSLCGD